MAAVKITGSGAIADSDYKFVKWVGKTKGGQAVTIELPKAICLSNPDWTFAEKNDTVPEVELSATYDDKKLAEGDRTEPWSIEYADGTTAGNGEIVLGVGKFYIGPTGGEYSATKTYAVGDIVIHDGKTYSCKTAITGAGEAWTAAHWEEVGPTYIGLTRGGGSFVVEREYREINADEDPGPVEGRIVQEGGRPKLKLKALQWLTKVSTLYAGMKTAN